MGYEIYFVIFSLLIKALCVPGIFCQNIQQPGSVIVRPSEQLQLTCTVSGFELTSFHIVHWARQLPGSKLEWIGCIWSDGSTYYADSLKNRISVTRDSAKKEFYIEINGAENKDTGRYYCTRYTVTENN
ncbi:unnamed protein product [Staurois parvus]|uniref:Ig-like domain-containing protein n=1 Tax=Staurois parvus TaxID=386267 RepID=A0ABN9FHQ3_9NEOB|nr:unnamed protein product [Staurois parvus]